MITNVNLEELPNIEKQEIEAALAQLRNNKAPGLEEILAEMLKEGKDEIMNTQPVPKKEIPQE